MREIDSISAMNKIKAINLGGITGSSGGQGAPPAGFIGQLAQKYVTYDTQELSTSASGTSLVSNLNRIRGGHALVDDSIIQRHIASGVGTLSITDGSTLIEQVKKVKFHNSILTGTDADCEVEIIAVTSGYYSLPDMTGHENEYLSNNGTVPIWNTSVGLVSSVFGRLGDVVATVGDYDHSQLSSIGIKTHPELESQLDSHILNNVVHLPSGTGFTGAFLATDGIIPFWTLPSGFGHVIQTEGTELDQRSHLNFIGAVTVTDNSVTDSTDVEILSGGHGILASGSAMTSRTNLNFTGNVIVTDDVGLDATTIEVLSGGHVILDAGTPVFTRPNLNFTGSFSVTDDAGLNSTTINIAADEATLATVAESKAGTINNKAVTPQGLPLRVESGALIHNQSYGGNARGTNAVDLQVVRSTVTQVASGNQSFIGSGNDNSIGALSQSSTIVAGQNNSIPKSTSSFIGAGDNNVITEDINTNATTESAIVAGTDNTITTQGAFIGAGQANQVSGFNGVVVGGFSNILTGDYSSSPGGLESKSVNYAQHVHSSGHFSIEGDAQGTIQMVLRREIDHSTNTGWQDLYLDGTSELITIPTDSTWSVEILLSAGTTGLTDRANYKIIGAVANIGGTTQIDAQTVTAIFETDAAWNVQLAVTGSNLLIQVTDGADAALIRWVATIRTSELIYS